MSTEFGDVAAIGPHPRAPLAADGLSVTRFWGGNSRGVCVQLTTFGGPPGVQYVQLTRDQWTEMRRVIDEAFAEFDPSRSSTNDAQEGENR